MNAGSWQHKRITLRAGMRDQGLANREKDEVQIEAGGKSYVLLMDFEAMCQAEDKMSTPEKDVTFREIVQKADRGSLRHIRAFLWAALIRRQPEMTLEDASGVIEALGGVAGLGKIVASVLKATKPDTEDLPKGKRPHQAQVNGEAVGTGATSTSRPVALA